jgi:hypothetical protein
MPDWQERITRETKATIRAEHELRYAAAAPIVHASAAWADLGCGTGLGAAAGLGATYEGCALLVDADPAAAEEAAAVVAAREQRPMTGDLTSPEELARIRAALLEAAPEGQRAITCFEVIEHLSTFVPLLEWLVALAREERTTAVLSVPNDAFWAVENPYHETVWSEGAVAELRSLLPPEHVLAHQVALHGSALARGPERVEDVATVAIAGGVPTHFLIAFGPDAGALAAAPRVVQTDLDDQRRWERQRESDAAFHVAAAAEAQTRFEDAEARLAETREQLRTEIARVAEFRAYIHELEDRLGLPRSGASGAEAAEAVSGAGQ